VGVFATLTNSYALVAVGASENFYRLVLERHCCRAEAEAES
jgi:translation initiation factor 6 (eIF-6)